MDKKIFLEKDDGVEAATDRVIRASSLKVIVNVPRNSVLGGSVKNFQLLKRESLTAGKQISIESIDDHILELAGMAGIPARNPVFKTRERTVSDILPRMPKKNKPSQAPVIQEKKDARVIAPITTLPQFEKQPFVRRKPLRFWVLVCISVLLSFFVLYEVVAEILPQASVNITIKRQKNTFEKIISIKKNLSEASTSSMSGEIIIPGELLVAKKNITYVAKTSLREKVETNARGKLEIVNEFSSSPQTLVKATRFESPDGKIYRLEGTVVIPGASIESGKIIASKIEVNVRADEAGKEYNISSSAGKWNIPGFKGTPKYSSFYGTLKGSMEGGFVGERAKPSDDDIKNAYKEVEVTLKNVLRNEMRILLKSGLTVPEGAENFKIIKQEIVYDDKNQNSFGVFADAELRAMAFNEESAKEALGSLLSNGLPEYLNAFTITPQYEVKSVDYNEGTLMLAAKGEVMHFPAFDKNALIRVLEGKSEDEFRSIIREIPGIETAEVSLWPFWVMKVPENPKKIEISIQ